VIGGLVSLAPAHRSYATGRILRVLFPRNGGWKRWGWEEREGAEDWRGQDGRGRKGGGKKAGEGNGRDLLDQCEIAFYAPV